MNYIKTLLDAKKNGTAVGAFNVFNGISIRAVVAASESRKQSVIIQTSVKTVRYYGATELYKLVHSVTDKSSSCVFLHLDHCRDIEVAKKCIEAGWDSIMYDGSALSLDENIRNTREVVLLAHKKNIFVEGELGKISGVEEDIVVESQEPRIISFDECIKFVKETGIDSFAPAIGTAHGIYRGTPHIDFQLVERLSKTLPQPIVIHGGTGLSEDTFKKLIRLGGCKINVSTALKNAYSQALHSYFHQDNYSKEPLDVDLNSHKKITEVVSHHIKLFSGE